MERKIASSILRGITDWVLFRPAVTKKVISAWSNGRAVFPAQGRHIVVSYSMAQQLLLRHRQFHLADAMSGRIAAGDFLLNLEPPGKYDSDKRLIREAFYGSSLGSPPLLDEIAEHCRQRSLDLLRGRTSIDVVGEFLEVISADVVIRFFLGLPRNASPEEVDHIRSLSKLIVAGDPSDLSLTSAANKAIDYLSELLDCVHHRYVEGSRTSNDAFTRMLDTKADLETAKRNVLGMATAGTTTISRAGGQALDSLLRQPARVIEAAREAANASNDELVLKFIVEALRFNPLFPFVLRKVVEDTTLEMDNGEKYLFEAGADVSISLLNAMFDPAVFPEPMRFRTDRPLHSYLHFGTGLHQCIGGAIAHVEFRSMFTELLRNPIRLRSDAKLVYDEGKALRNLQVEWPA